VDIRNQIKKKAQTAAQALKSQIIFEAKAKAAVDALLVSHGGLLIDPFTGEQRYATAPEVLAMRKLQRFVRRWLLQRSMQSAMQQLRGISQEDIDARQRTKLKVRVLKVRARSQGALHMMSTSSASVFDER
jgi:hypothetical protein